MAISEQTESMELATPQEQNQQAEFNQLDDHMYGAGTRESPVGGLSTHQEEVPEAINIRFYIEFTAYFVAPREWGS
ncbi:hypothetical protein V6N13_103107 [Hibiscus sabdariffa]